jgi:hypothetical protein
MLLLATVDKGMLEARRMASQIICKRLYGCMYVGRFERRHWDAPADP